MQHTTQLSPQIAPVNTLADRYDGEASAWDGTLERLGYQEAYQEVFQKLQAEGWLNNLPSDAKVLDAGIGTGALSRGLARLVPNLRLTGIDISADMLSVARRNLSAFTNRLSLRQTGIDEFALEAESYDFVMSAYMLEHLDDPQAAIEKLADSLKPNGTMFIVMTRRSFFGAYIRLKWGIRPTTKTELHDWLAEVGLRDITPVKLNLPFGIRGGTVAYIATK